MAFLFDARLQAINASGTPLSGATLNFYRGSTSTAITTYQDADATTPHPSPVVADSTGTFPAIFLNTVNDYKFILKDQSGITIATVDDIPVGGQIDAGSLADAVTYAEEWAINPEDDPVSVAAGGDDATTFSALHWAKKAADQVAGVIPSLQRFAVGAAVQSADLGNEELHPNSVRVFIEGVYQFSDTWDLTDGVLTPVGGTWPGDGIVENMEVVIDATSAIAFDVPSNGSVTLQKLGTDVTDILDDLEESSGSSAGSLFGLTLSNNALDANNDIDIFSGSCRDIGDTVNMVLAATITKRLDAAWAAGSAAGGLDTGAKTSSTGYHVWLIKNPTSGIVDALFSTSATNPNMPGGYTLKRRLGAVLTDGSGNIRQFLQTGGFFELFEPIVYSAGDIDSATPLLKTLPVPLGVKLQIDMFMSATASVGGYNQVWDVDLGGLVSTTQFARFYQPAGVITSAGFRVWCSVAGQVYMRGTQGAAVTTTTIIHGWFDIRDISV